MKVIDVRKEEFSSGLKGSKHWLSERCLLSLMMLVMFLGGPVALAQEQINDMIKQTRALREKLLSDAHRPGYHFVTLEGRCSPFDPNGAIFWKGRYHMFYIFQDSRGHNWGHASSIDLVHWRHHPTGLVSGMFSGNCFINKDGVPTMCYHQTKQGGH